MAPYTSQAMSILAFRPASEKTDEKIRR